MKRFEENTVHLLSWLLLILSARTASVLSLEIRISPDAPELTKRHGDGLSLTCSLFPEPLTDVNLQWINPQNQVVTNTNSSENLHISRENHELYLYVVDVRKHHDGNWTCTTMINGQTFEKSILISTWKPITFIDPKRLQQPILGTTALIECQVESEPIATVKWTIKGRPYTGEGDRYTQERNGLKVKNISEADNGMYQCKAEITQKASMEILSIRVAVAVPPQLVKPPKITDPVAGTNLTMTCEATGKPKPTYKFYKVYGSDVEIRQSARISVNEEEGTLIIRNLVQDDSSQYKCTAKNIGGTADSIVRINVQVPPRILQIDENSVADAGSMKELTCGAEGTPAPDITWAAPNGRVFHANTGTVEGPSVIIVSTNNDEQSQAKLRFEALEPSDMGEYTCTAYNNVPPSASAKTTLSVRYKPHFGKTPLTTAYNWAGANRSISCTAYGFPAPVISWLFGDSTTELTDSPDYSIDTDPIEESEATSYLTVKIHAGNEDAIYGMYKCVARNAKDTTKHSIAMERASVPGPPQVSQPDLGSKRITLSISLPSNNGGVAVQGYRVVYAENAPNSGEQTVDIKIDKNRIRDDEPTPRTMAKLDGLNPNTKYTVSVAAKNAIGYGDPHVMQLQTRPITVPGLIDINSGSSSISPTQYKLTWEQPDTGGLPLSNYIINIRQVTVNESTNKIIDIGTAYDPITVAPDRTSHTLTNLAPNRTYQISIIAVNSKGQSNNKFIIIRTYAVLDDCDFGMCSANFDPFGVTGGFNVSQFEEACRLLPSLPACKESLMSRCTIWDDERMSHLWDAHNTTLGTLCNEMHSDFLEVAPCMRGEKAYRNGQRCIKMINMTNDQCSVINDLQNCSLDAIEHCGQKAVNARTMIVNYHLNMLLAVNGLNECSVDWGQYPTEVDTTKIDVTTSLIPSVDTKSAGSTTLVHLTAFCSVLSILYIANR